MRFLVQVLPLCRLRRAGAGLASYLGLQFPSTNRRASSRFAPPQEECDLGNAVTALLFSNCVPDSVRVRRVCTSPVTVNLLGIKKIDLL